MRHLILGELKSDGQRAPGLIGQVNFEGRVIPLSINPDDKPVEEAIEFAAQVVTRLDEINQKAKTALTRDLLESYNGGWNAFQIAQDDGTFKTVENPQLNAAEFESKFELKAIDITSDCCTDLWYEDKGLFWGHGVFVEFLDGLEIEHAEAQLFG